VTPPAEHLDLRAALPRGLSAVEASAGTGKTFALTALAVRGIVLDDVRTEQLLVVTFTRAAVAELRGRVRDGLRDATRALRALATTGEVPAGLDDWLDALCRDDGGEGSPPPPPAEAQRRAAAAARALSTLDRATITTIHGFCQASLTQLGLRGTGGGHRFTTDARRLRGDVVRDRLLTLLHHDPDALRRIRKQGDESQLEAPKELERRVDQLVTSVLSSDARVVPLGLSSEPVADATARFVEDVVEDLRARLEREGELTFDELVSRMDATLADDDVGPVAARQLRERLRLVLVDEMQDTDAVQWRIFERAFLADPERLGAPSDVVIVGDPKQSIYRFRGADIDAYLEASERAGEQRRELGRNWRSSGPLLAALDVLMRGASFGGPRIAYQQVLPGRPTDPRVLGTGAPLELRWMPRTADLLSSDGHAILTGPGEALLLDDVADRVVALLREGRVVATDEDRASGVRAVDEAGTRALDPHDIAVLVRKNKDATAVVERLAVAGVPAVRPKGGRVYDAEAFVQWRVLLSALARPSELDLVRALLVSWFVDVPVGDLDDDAVAQRLQERCGAWRDVVGADGVLALLAELRVDHDVAPALARAGERGLTDLEHLAELLHVAVGARGVPAGAALRTLEELALAADRDEDDTDDPAVRRIGSDGDAVQVMTFHGAKGLEFPVVLLPFSNRAQNLSQPWMFRTTIVHDGEKESVRVADAGSTLAWTPVVEPGEPHPDLAHARRAHRERLARAEAAGDESRLLYVALTRARDRCIVWWWPVARSSSTLLATLLFGERDGSGTLLPDAAAPKLPELTDALTEQRLVELARRAEGTVDIERIRPDAPDRRHRREEPPERSTLEVATLSRDVHEPDVWRWSFTGLLRTLSGGQHDPTPATGTDEPDVPEGPGAPDDPAAGPAADPAADPGAAPVAVGPLIGLPGGTGFGVLVHEVLEVVDLSAEPEQLAEALRREVGTRAISAAMPVDVERLTSGLLAALATPLDPILPGLALRDVASRDRVPELLFELPVADTHARVSVADLARAVADALAPDDPYRDTFATLTERVDRARFAGWLAGIVDLALRTPDGRYVVADYKTNRLSDRHGRPSYDAQAMHAAMRHGEYPLQALLYLVGLHRILARRLSGYDPEVHLGGAAFLFVRGMVGEGTPLRDGVRDGVSVWCPAPAAVLAADAVLRGAS
jgi:exodeoxyribonuclease V beta subunit